MPTPPALTTCRLLAVLLPPLLSGAAWRPQPRPWQQLATTPPTEGRSECGVAAVQGRLYVLGGDNPTRPVEVLDLATARWQAKAPSPVPLHHFQAVAYQGSVYVLAAFSQGDFPNQEPADHAYRYDPTTDTWHALAGLPAARRRAGAGAAAHGGKLYLVAGIQHGHSSGTTGQFDEYDPATNTWRALPNAPHPRDHSQAVVVGHKLYAVGGRNTSYHEPDNFMAFFSHTVQAVDCYDFQTGRWATLAAALPQGTGGGTAAAWEGKIFYMGGERATATLPNRAQKDVYYLDVAAPAGRWLKAADLHLARNGVGSAVSGGALYVAGGAAGPPPADGGMPGPPPGGSPGGPPPSGTPGGPGGPPPGTNPNGLAVEVLHLR